MNTDDAFRKTNSGKKNWEIVDILTIAEPWQMTEDATKKICAGIKR